MQGTGVKATTARAAATPGVRPDIGRAGKADRLGLKVPDQPGRFEWILKDRLLVDLSYQRKANPGKVERMAAGWSWVALGVLIVARRGGKLYVIDGDHRVLAARRLAEVTQLPCMVFQTVTAVEEARGFLASNTDRRPLSALDRFRAQVTVGDGAAVLVQRLLDEAGYTLATGVAVDVRQTKCVGVMLRLAQADRASFLRAWPLILEVAAGGPIYELVVHTIGHVERRLDGTGESLTQDPWRQRLVRMGTTGILDATTRAATYHGKRGVRVWAIGLVDALNRGLRNRLTLPTGQADERPEADDPKPEDIEAERSRLRSLHLEDKRDGAPRHANGTACGSGAAG
jgi:hypothetical protein